MVNVLLEGYGIDAPQQNAAIQCVLKERGKTVYATALGKGAILANNGKIHLLGDVKIFNPKIK